jgi:hypothetical protein
MIQGEYANILDFGAVGDGVTDDTAAFQAAAAFVDANDKTLYLPSGNYVVSQQIVFDKPPSIIGEKYSPPITGTFPPVGGTPYAKKGTLITSKVASGYAIVINPPANNDYIRGVQITNLHLLADATNTTGGGISINNCGWQGYINGLCVEGFKFHGIKLSQLQDTLFDQLTVVRCGTDNVHPALWITDGTNLIEFNRPQIELNDWHMQIDSAAFAIVFVGAHIEIGDYPVEITGGNVIPRHPSIRVLATTNQIKFIGCIFYGPTLEATMDKYSITADQCPYYIFCDGSTFVTFDACSIGCGYNNGKLLNMTCDGIVSNCDFSFLCVETNPINLDGNVLFRNNNIGFNDYNSTTAMNGLVVSSATVEGNLISALNNSSPTKTSGAIFDSDGTGRIGQNQLIIQKYHLIFAGAPIQISFNPTGNDFQDYTGSVDAQEYDPSLTWAASTTGTMTNIVNFMNNQTIRIRNASGGTFTVQHGSNIALKGGVNAAMPSGTVIELQANPFTGTMSELWRSF